MAAPVPTMPPTLPAPALGLPAAPGKWQREHEAFLRLTPQHLATYAGQYVVIHNGQVVASGPDDVALALQFFAQHGNVAVHIGLVTPGPEPTPRIPHYGERKPGTN